VKAPSSYWAATAEAGLERQRLRLLQQRYDELSIRRLRSLGPLAGRFCLEVGAGAGSVAAWLADAVGPAGSVVATDLDPRFLDELAGRPNVEVRRHDILNDQLEEAAFDLVHCRALLCHLADPALALRRMTAALRPGGWLLVEEADFVTLQSADADHWRTPVWNRAVGTMVRLLATTGVFDPHCGRRLPGLLASLPLEDLASEGLVRVHSGGSPPARFLVCSFEAQTKTLEAAGVFEDGDAAAVAEALTDPSFLFADACSFAARGRRSHEASGVSTATE